MKTYYNGLDTFDNVKFVFAYTSNKDNAKVFYEKQIGYITGIYDKSQDLLDNIEAKASEI